MNKSFKQIIDHKVRTRTNIFSNGSFKTHDGNSFSFSIIVSDGKARLKLDFGFGKVEVLDFSCIKRLMNRLKEYKKMKTAGLIMQSKCSNRICVTYDENGCIMQV